MPPLKTLLAVACVALAASLLPAPSLAAPMDGGVAPVISPSSPPTARRVAAERALATVRAAFGDPSSARGRRPEAARPADLTMAMLELRRRVDDLAPTEQATARRYLARPTDGAADPDGFGYEAGAAPTSDCARAPQPGSHVCVTWATRTVDAPPSGDRDRDGVPDQVEQTRDVVDAAWKRLVTEAGYLPPLADGRGPRVDGSRDRLDIYLSDIGWYGYYGYCVAESLRPRGAAPAFCVLDDDFARAQFRRNTPQENLEVTAAHEFFHAIQFRYDVGADLWFMEGTAAWVEDELYDRIDDNRQYLHDSPLTQPNIPLDYTGQDRHPYGNWVFWRYLSERFPAGRAGSPVPDIVRQVWSRARYVSAAQPGAYSLQALVRTLADRGVAFRALFGSFGETARHPRRGFEEGRAYPRAPLAARYTLSRAHPRSGWRTFRVHQLANRTVAFVPGPGLAGRWRLHVRVDAPDVARGSYARVTVYRSSGRLVRKVVRLGVRGNGARRVAFSTPEVRRVEVTLTNASTRYACHQQTGRSCNGRPKDDPRRTRIRAVAVR